MGAQGHDHAWLGSRATRVISDIVLGCVSAVAGGAAIASARGEPLVQAGQMGPWAFPGIIGHGLAVIGAALLLRGCFIRTSEPARWSGRAALAIVPAIAVVVLVAWGWGRHVLLLFGPSEFVALFVLMLAIGIATVRGSLLRSIGMASLGLLLATVGTEISSGSDRYTFGLEQLADGIAFPVLALGLIFGADALLGLVSPSLALAIDARHVAGLANRVLARPVTLGLRVLAAMMLAVVIYAALLINNSMFDVYLLLAFAVVGVACKLLDWSRLVMLLAFALEQPLEENVRRALMIARGDTGTFLRWPLSLTMLLLACAALAAAALLSASHAARLRRRAG
jgi:TctA family transporter